MRDGKTFEELALESWQREQEDLARAMTRLRRLELLATHRRGPLYQRELEIFLRDQAPLSVDRCDAGANPDAEAYSEWDGERCYNVTLGTGGPAMGYLLYVPQGHDQPTSGYYWYQDWFELKYKFELSTTQLEQVMRAYNLYLGD